MRLDLALIHRHPALSRRKAREVIEKGHVSVGKTIVREPGAPVAADAAIVYDPNRRSLPRARLSLPLLFRDEHLLVVDKPAGLLTVASSPEATGEDTALLRVEDFVRHLSPRHPFVGVVHRIDRDTSGAVCFALNATARSELKALFRAHRIERRYAAIVEGLPQGERGIVSLPIRDTYVSGRRRVARSGEAAHAALTRWAVAERFPTAALLDVELETGRQHQIRIHLAHIGLPILGDTVYGPGERRGGAGAPRQMLHAKLLAFVHPITGEAVRVESPLPEDFRRVVAGLRRRRP